MALGNVGGGEALASATDEGWRQRDELQSVSGPVSDVGT
jgi:hypothetical protein